MPKTFISFIKDESGLTMIEYSIIGSLIGLAAIGSLEAVGDGLIDTFSTASTNIDSSNPDPGVGDSTPPEAQGEDSDDPFEEEYSENAGTG